MECGCGSSAQQIRDIHILLLSCMYFEFGQVPNKLFELELCHYLVNSSKSKMAAKMEARIINNRSLCYNQLIL